MPLVENTYDSNARKVSLYGKATNAADSAVGVDAVGALQVNPGALSASLDFVLVRQGIADTVSTPGVLTGTTGSALSYSVPSGNDAIVDVMNFINLAGSAPTVRIRYTNPAGSVHVLTQTSLGPQLEFTKNLSLPLAGGSVIEWFVSTAGSAASSASALIGVRRFPWL